MITEEQAFRAGAMDYPHYFYDSPLWRVNLESFEDWEIYTWGAPQLASLDGGKNWSFQIAGQLKDDVFETDRLDTTNKLKLAYIRGRLSSYSVNVKETGIDVNWANSTESRDRFVRFLKEVLDFYRSLKFVAFLPYSIIVGQEINCCPIVNFIKLEANKEIVDYIIGTK